MSFESGGQAQDPFAEEPETEDQAVEPPADELDETPETTTGEAEAVVETEPPVEDDTHTPGSSADAPVEETGGEDAHPIQNPPYVTDLSIRDPLTVGEMARALTVPEFREEAPANIPYATWRDGTSTGRGRLTIEMNKDLDELVKQVTREFEEVYGEEIHKADVRELALMYGLMHVEELFGMAEEWGLQYG